ncbi:MAG: CCA tRNA nucleotidyltransferase [Hyphomonadaceae bacterium]|nr:CCA tRNA nucleotidyltransferase [Hyphomonadaceae bacterium]
MKLDPKKHAWLNAKPARRIFDALPDDSARYVGGCVRNALLGAPVADYDIATTVLPEDVASALKANKISVHETGIAHGTLTAVADNTVFEITTLRRDVTTDGRRATVEFSKDWTEDAFRRDFTVNALYADPQGKIFDPTGQGVEDIKTRRIRFVDDPVQRIQEDYLRILRFFRFYAWYGDGKAMDKPALTACRDLKDGLNQLSVERIWSETKKLLAAPSPHRTVNAMLINGILEKLLPEASNAEGLQRLIDVERMTDLTPDPYLRLMSMAARDEFAMAGLTRRLKMANVEKTRLLGWAGDRAALKPGLSDKDLKIEIFKAGRQVAMDRSVLRAAGADDPIIKKQWLAVFDTAREWDWPEFPLSGKDLIEAGVPKGTSMGKALAALEALWIRSGFTADKTRLIAALALIHRA